MFVDLIDDMREIVIYVNCRYMCFRLGIFVVCVEDKVSIGMVYEYLVKKIDVVINMFLGYFRWILESIDMLIVIFLNEFLGDIFK